MVNVLTKCLSYRTVFDEALSVWKMVRGGQLGRAMKILIGLLARISRIRLPGSHYLSKRWFKTISDMARCRSQCRCCIPNLSSSAELQSMFRSSLPLLL